MKKGGDPLRFIKTIYFLIKRVPSVVFLGSWLVAGAVVVSMPSSLHLNASFLNKAYF